MLGLRCCMQAFSSCGKQGQLFVAVYRLLTAVASVVVEHWLSCSMACGIFPDQGLNPWPLHWQTDSYALYYQGSPRVVPSYLFQCGFIAYPRGYIRILSLFCCSNYFFKLWELLQADLIPAFTHKCGTSDAVPVTGLSLYALGGPKAPG